MHDWRPKYRAPFFFWRQNAHSGRPPTGRISDGDAVTVRISTAACFLPSPTPKSTKKHMGGPTSRTASQTGGAAAARKLPRTRNGSTAAPCLPERAPGRRRSHRVIVGQKPGSRGAGAQVRAKRRKARAAKLTAEERMRIAKKAAAKRWKRP